MPLKYSLYKNPVKEGAYRAMPRDNTTYFLEDIINKMDGMGTSFNRPDIVGILHLYHQVVSDILEEGDSINTPLVKFQHSIQGDFADASDRIYPNRQKVRINVLRGKEIKNLEKHISTQKIKSNPTGPYITYIYNLVTKQRDELTIGNAAQIKGSQLKINPDDQEHGVFLTDANGKQTRISSYIKSTKSEILFVVPASLQPGQYHVHVCNTLRKSPLRKHEYGNEIVLS
jgi:hypothetical protein